ncbi:hypothetical protein ACJZ2D_008747 [Fusarium nematophilum]
MNTSPQCPQQQDKRPAAPSMSVQSSTSPLVLLLQPTRRPIPFILASEKWNSRILVLTVFQNNIGGQNTLAKPSDVLPNIKGLSVCGSFEFRSAQHSIYQHYEVAKHQTFTNHILRPLYTSTQTADMSPDPNNRCLQGDDGPPSERVPRSPPLQLPRLRLSEHPVREPVQHPEQEPDSAAARNRKRIWAYHIYETALAHPETRPLAQFRKQVDREHRRLLYQRRAQSRGRPQTLPFDPCLTVRKNAENNVRTYWVDQGIWEERWGPAWEAGPNPLKVDDDGEVGGDGPFQGRHDPVKAGDWISYITRWGHEEPAPAQEKCPTDGRPRPDPLTYLYLPTCPHGPVSLYYPPRPFVQYPDASRPHRQYVYQVRKESEWIRDEWWEGKQSSYIFETPPSDPIGKAFEDVKKQWIDDGIWNSAWDTVPGSTWAHEGLYPLASWYPHAGDHSLKHSRESGSLFFGSFGMRRDGNKDMERVGSERES